MGEGNISHRITLNGNILENGFSLVIPFIPEYGINYGVTSKMDVIGKFNLFGSWSIGGKYTLVGDMLSNTAIAVGPTFNFYGSIFNFTVPLHITIEPSDVFTFTLTPSYTSSGLTKLKESNSRYYRDIYNGFVGISPYIEVGKKVRFIFGCNFSFARSQVFTDYGFGVKITSFTDSEI